MKVKNLIIVSVVATIQLLRSFRMASAQMPGETVGSLPPNEMAEVMSILLTGTVMATNCTPNNSVIPEVRYFMYNRQNRNGYLMSNFDNVDYSKGLYIVLYGWLGNKDVDYIKVIRDAYLQRYDTNVITVGYEDSVSGDYTTAICNMPAIGSNMAEFMCILERYYDLSKLHIVGHSYGAHLGGLASRLVQEVCQLNVGRLTGLDPAGPGFQIEYSAYTLEATDANFVDVIHTNQGQFGYTGNEGDIDFYVNCGYFQPSCPPILQNLTPTTNIMDLELADATCGHQRSCFLFAESILMNDFLASPRLSPMLCMTMPDNSTDRVYMGQYCTSPQRSHNYYVNTNANSPYGMGPNGPLN